MSELLPCPFCGGEAEPFNPFGNADGTWCVLCSECASATGFEQTEAEAIAAWNNRTPIEYDGWFYLPKPKEAIAVYSDPEITRTENGYKVRNSAYVVNEAARKWGEELGEYTMQRICEIWNSRADYHGYEKAAIEAWESVKAWNSRAERTCHIEWRDDSHDTDAGYEHDGAYFCTACGADLPYPLQESWDDYQAGNCEKPFNCCPSCGCKVVGE